MGERGHVYRRLMGKLRGKSTLGRHKHRWEFNKMVDLQEVDCAVWTGWIWLRIGVFSGTCECGDVSSGSIK